MFCVTVGALNLFTAGRKQVYEWRVDSQQPAPTKNNKAAGYTSFYTTATNAVHFPTSAILISNTGLQSFPLW